MTPNAVLVLKDGSCWPGTSFGWPLVQESGSFGQRASAGELVFNTAMAGYQEILTDPSYSGQVILFTYPHIGNYGCRADWSECGVSGMQACNESIAARGLVVREIHEGPIPEGHMQLTDFLKQNRITGICGVDTRALTIKLRQEGSCNAVIVAARKGLLSRSEHEEAHEYCCSMPSMEGFNLASTAGIDTVTVLNPQGSPCIALLDCGVKKSIVQALFERRCKVVLFPASACASDILAASPDALLISNGPGDPSALAGIIAVTKELIGKLPLFGICLGHQILALGLGGSTWKMPFGHHGANHPVRDMRSGRVFVTSQNHGFAVDEQSLPEGCFVSFRNANDGTVEGFENAALKIACVQHHPEAAPGPVDSRWIFDMFLAKLLAWRGLK